MEQERLEEAQAGEGQLALELEETSIQLSTVQQAFETRQLERALAEKTVKEMQQSLGILTNRQMQLKARLIERKVQTERRQALIREAREKLLVSEKSLISLEHSFELSTKKQNEYEAGRLAAENALQAHLSQQAKLESEHKKVGESRVEIATPLKKRGSPSKT